jgi:anti-sigma B factor antagonist
MTIQKQEVHVTSSSGEPRGIEVTEVPFEPSGLVVAVSGELDIATASALRDRLDAAIKAGKHRLVIDLFGVDFLDSVALATIVHARKELPEAGRLALAVEPGSYPMLIFESSGLNKMLDLVASREQAIALVSS